MQNELQWDKSESRETRQEATARDSDSGDDGLCDNMDIEPI